MWFALDRKQLTARIETDISRATRRDALAMRFVRFARGETGSEDGHSRCSALDTSNHRSLATGGRILRHTRGHDAPSHHELWVTGATAAPILLFAHVGVLGKVSWRVLPSRAREPDPPNYSMDDVLDCAHWSIR